MYFRCIYLWWYHVERFFQPGNIWEKAGPHLNVMAHTHPFFLNVFSSVCGSTLSNSGLA